MITAQKNFKIAFFFLACGSCFQLRAELCCKPVATLGSKTVITDQDVWDRGQLSLKLMGQPFQRAWIQKFYGQILNMLIQEHQQIKWVHQFQTRSHQEDVEASFKEWLDQMKKIHPGLVLTPAEIKSIKVQIAANQGWSQYLQAKYGNLLKVNQKEILRYQKKYTARCQQPSYKYGEIVLYYQKNYDKKLHQLQELRTLMDQGIPLTTLAAQFSEAPSKKSRGIVEKPVSQIDPTIIQTLKNVPEGELVGPTHLASQKAIAFFILFDKKEAQKVPPITLKQAEEALIQEKMEIFSRQEMRKLQANSCSTVLHTPHVTVTPGG